MSEKEKFWNYKKIIVTVWIVISVLYIWFDLYNRVVFRMYNNWYESAINSIIEQAGNKDCKSFTVYNEKNKVELVNIACIQQVNNQPTESK